MFNDPNESFFACCGAVFSPVSFSDVSFQTTDPCEVIDECCFPSIENQDLVCHMLQLLPPGDVWALNKIGYPAGPIPPQYGLNSTCGPDTPITQTSDKASILFFKALLEEVNEVRDYIYVALNETQPCGAVYTRDRWLNYLPRRLLCTPE